MINETWSFVGANYANEFIVKRWYLNVIFIKASVEWNLTQGLDYLTKHTSMFNERPQSPLKYNTKWAEWIESVKQELPPFPWPQSVSRTIGLKLSISTIVVKRIIQYLIENGEI